MICLICPGCRKKLGLPENTAGKPVRCPACQAAFRAPALEAEAPSPSEAVIAAAPGPPAPPEDDVLEEVSADDGIVDAELVKRGNDAEPLSNLPRRRKRRRRWESEYQAARSRRPRRGDNTAVVEKVVMAVMVVVCVLVLGLCVTVAPVLSQFPNGLKLVVLAGGVPVLFLLRMFRRR